MDWSLREGYAWAEDKEHCEEYGRMLQADPTKVSARAKKRGLPQLGTLGAGNHYCEIQIVDEIYDVAAANKMGINRTGQVVVMIHSGSRGKLRCTLQASCNRGTLRTSFNTRVAAVARAKLTMHMRTH